MKHILWLASWYPDKLQPLNGDFIERHAKAASQYHKITVLHVVKDDKNLVNGKFFVERKKYNDNCLAVILYYKPFSGTAVIERSLAAVRFFIFFAELIRDHIADNGKPDLIHVHVSWRAGLLALYCRKKYKIPFAVSEHWTGFLPGAADNYSSKNALSKIIISRIFRMAHKVSAVSKVLAEALEKQFNIKKPFIIPNVVDTKQFVPAENQNDVFRFIHISELTAAKNPLDIIRAVMLLAKKTTEKFEIVFFSPVKKELLELISASGMETYFRFEGPVPHAVIATELSKADCLVLYSAYETFGCVVIEAMACGIPVIVSEIPVMHELVSAETGIFVQLNDAELLADKMLWMMNNHQTSFDKSKIAQYTADKFGMEITGKKFDEFYNA